MVMIGVSSMRMVVARPAGVALQLLVVALALLAAGTDACTKEEYGARFGAAPTYRLEHKGDMAPAIENGHLVVTATYESACAGGGSQFVADTELKNGMHVVIARREEPACEGADVLSAPEVHTVRATAPLEAATVMAAQKFIAFPPDGDYELFLLKDRAPTSPATEIPATPKAADSLTSPKDTKEASEGCSMGLGEEAAADHGDEKELSSEQVAEKLAELAIETEEDSREHLNACRETIAAGKPKPSTGCCCKWMMDQLELKLAKHESDRAAGLANASAMPVEKPGFDIDAAARVHLVEWGFIKA